MCEFGHKRGHLGHINGDAELCCMSCDARTHVAAYGIKKSGVMRMVEEPGRETSILEHGLINFLIVFF